jgi:quercetin dioxygenase-like cupin family protein
MPVVTAAENRRTETPNAVMTTLASPTQGETAGLSLWRVSMTRDAEGPHHVFDTEQIWTVLSGSATVLVGDDLHQLTTGDTVVIPAGVARRITAGDGFEALVAGHGGAVAQVVGEPDPRGTPAWIA